MVNKRDLNNAIIIDGERETVPSTLMHVADVGGYVVNLTTVMLEKNRFGRTGVYRLDEGKMMCACEEKEDGKRKFLQTCGLHANHVTEEVEHALERERTKAVVAIQMLLWCPECGERHVDAGEFATKIHRTHACQSCGHCWRPAIVPTVGVRFLPGFKNDGEK